MDQDESSGLLFVPVADSDDARRFIELSSHAADLTEALEALRLASRVSQDDPSGEAKVHLFGAAVVAYCRAFLHSNVRSPLGDYVVVPAELREIHEAIKAFRNRTVAHSQSELTVTHAVGVVDPRSNEVKGVHALTVGSTLPDSIARAFAELVGAVLDLLDEVIDPVRKRLEDALRAADPEVLVAAAPLGIQKMADDWSPKSTRARYPTAQTIYWDRDPNA